MFERMPKRTRVLLAILTVLAGAALVWHGWVTWQIPARQEGAVAPPPLPGKNAVTNLKVERDAQGRWFANFDYYYTGSPPAVSVGADPRDSEASPFSRQGSAFQAALRGSHRVRFEVIRPAEPTEAIRSRFVFAELRAPAGAVVARQVLSHEIDWPDVSTWLMDHQAASSDPQQVLALAAGLIDQGTSNALNSARAMLERQVARDPRFEAAYIELARVAMKAQPWPDGLLQARRLLDSALQIRPDSTDGKILLGYTLTHLGEYAKARTQFSEAAASGSSNLWLWANWGELQTLQGQIGPAIDNYRKVLSHPAKGDRNDRPRLDAYERLVALLRRQGDIDGVEALLRKRYEETGPGSCFGIDYARFLLEERGNTEQAVALAHAATEPRCAQNEGRRIQALARYLEWSRAPAGPERVALLNQAQVLLPIGPTAIRELARSDRTADVVRALMASGERVDQFDGRKYNALGYALMERDHGAARRLLRLGAKATTAVGEPPTPVGLLPIMASDADGVRLLLQAGVDYGSLRFEGTTALDIARKIGDPAVLKALRGASVAS